MKFLKDSVRRELSLPARDPRRRRSALRSSLLGLSASMALLGGLASSPARALSYNQELIPDFTSLKVASFSSPDLVDLDADGDLDAVVGQELGRLVYFANTGSSSAPAFVELTGGANPLAGIAGATSNPELVDLDGDGDLDAVLGEADGTLRYFANIGSASAASFEELTGSDNPFAGADVGLSSSPALVDLDGDGDLDAVAGESLANLHYFENTGSSSAPAFVEQFGFDNPFSAIVSNYTYDGQPALSDMDADGDLDLILGEREGTLLYFTNTGSAAAPAFVEVFVSANPFDGIDVGTGGHPALADLDGDGDLDVLVGETYGGLRYFENTGSAALAAFVELTGSANPFGGDFDASSSSHPDLRDLDGDGDLDAVVGVTLGTLRYLENTGSPGVPLFVERSATDSPFDGIDVGTASSPVLADLDGDGDPDLVAGEDGGTLFYFENTGSPAAPSFIERLGSANPFSGIDVSFSSHPDLVDLDGDGDLDTVIGRAAGGLRYLRNNGSSTAPVFVHLTGTANPFAAVTTNATDPCLADLDGDGDLDLLIGSGNMVYFENTGSPSAPLFVERTGSGNPLGAVFAVDDSSPDLADIDGDGDFDAFLGGRSGRVVFVRANSVDLFADGFESGNTSAWSITTP